MYKEKGRLTQKNAETTAWSAIQMRCKEADKSQGLQSLQRNLINGPMHCFGQHDRCSPDF